MEEEDNRESIPESFSVEKLSTVVTDKNTASNAEGFEGNSRFHCKEMV